MNESQRKSHRPLARYGNSIDTGSGYLTTSGDGSFEIAYLVAAIRTFDGKRLNIRVQMTREVGCHEWVVFSTIDRPDRKEYFNGNKQSRTTDTRQAYRDMWAIFRLEIALQQKLWLAVQTAATLEKLGLLENESDDD